MLFQRIDTGEVFQAKTPATIVFGEATINIDGKPVKCRKVGGDTTGLPPSLVSDTLGVPEQSVAKYQAEALAAGFSGVEFKPDPLEPKFYQAHFSGPEERQRYEKFCGLVNKSGQNGGQTAFAPGHLDQAKRQVVRQYGEMN
jgi:hypothetical protein